MKQEGGGEGKRIEFQHHFGTFWSSQPSANSFSVTGYQQGWWASPRLPPSTNPQKAEVEEIQDSQDNCHDHRVQDGEHPKPLTWGGRVGRAACSQDKQSHPWSPTWGDMNPKSFNEVRTPIPQSSSWGVPFPSTTLIPAEGLISAVLNYSI